MSLFAMFQSAGPTGFAVSPKAVPLAGNYLADSNVKKPRADAEDAALGTRLWAESEKIVQTL
jgi:hypothetical protein